MKAKIIGVITGVVFLTSAIAVAVQNQGAKDLKLDGGSRGIVPFPHHLHQNAMDDCNACHSIFPKTAGIIKDLKQQGKLKKKQVMNKTCIKCHKAKKKAGVKAGPTTCSKCHVK
ncbi:MAG: cytochrome c3 family protein [Deltaproteobacteria bacterium]|nr:cytochrome c3 family protein [Deltaproteobacteria bacterium]MBW2565003.1 cytochrome c3 family protein [Deltaproteobacteria bacterium]